MVFEVIESSIKETENEKVAWNLSQQIIFQISELLQQASKKFTSGDIEGSYWQVREVVFLIHSNLTLEEIKGLKRIERRIEKILKKSRIRLTLFLTLYRERIMELLSKYDYLVSKKQDSTKMF